MKELHRPVWLEQSGVGVRGAVIGTREETEMHRDLQAFRRLFPE